MAQSGQRKETAPIKIEMTGQVLNTKDLRGRLGAMLESDRERFFGKLDEKWIEYALDYFWDESHQELRLGELKKFGFLPGSSRLLDLAAGCGQFVFHALKNDYDCYGVEPEDWKLEFIRDKAEASSLPEGWQGRIVKGFGEKLPYKDNSFDCVTSFQTLEHVQDPHKVLSEMVRVTKKGGGIHLCCPDYRGTFEAHYQLPWLPLFPRSLARLYLRSLGRPTAGLDTIKYTTNSNIRKSLLRIQREANVRLLIIRNDRTVFFNALKKRGIPQISGFFKAWQLLQFLRSIGRRELNVNLFIRVLEK